MKNGIKLVRASLAVGALALLMMEVGVVRSASSASPAKAQKVERGRYLVQAGGCHDCHTPKKMGPQGPEPDLSRALSGHPEGSKLPSPPRLPEGPWAAVASWDLTAWSGPWGVSYTFNLTSDENTGIGSWSEETFVKTLRTGRHMGVSRPILPPMPWQNYSTLEEEDLKAIYAYLRSLPPIRNRVPQPVIAANAGRAAN